MAQITEIKRTVGDFRRFSNMSFPLDTDGLEDMQTNDALISALGNIGGNKYILSGLDSTTGFAGYVFLATRDFPMGELLYVRPATTMVSHLRLRIDPVNIDAAGIPFTNAYTQRTLEHGIPEAGIESFLRAEFQPIETNAQLKTRVDNLTREVQNSSPEAVGSIKMWASHNIPPNWLVCAGQQLSAIDYPELSRVLGHLYGGSGNNFKLPDLQGNSVFGYKEGDPEFGALNRKGGVKRHALLPGEMPKHSHIVPGFGLDGGANRDFSDGGGSRSAHFGRKNPGHVTTEAGDGLAHNNLPPYIALNFIIRAK